MTDWEEHARLLGLTSDKIDKLTSDAFNTLLERIRDGADPRDAVNAIIAAFDPAYREVLAAAFAITLARSVGSAELVSYPVGEVALSQRLYQMAAETSSVVQAIVERHAAGFQDARQLALQIYEGYGFNATEPIKWSRRNPKLPKYMRSELLTDPGLTGDLQRLFARIQVAKIKTPALRAGYMEAIDAMEKGKGARLLKKKLMVAFEERMRYHANRIAQTELHRAWVDKQAREIMDDDSIEVVQFKMSETHPATDICDLFAKQDKYGLGPGMYPKEYAPKPPLHPFCLPGDTLITASGRVTAVTKRWFDGNLVVITTASGKRLSATVNHPVLTLRGWVGAGLLDIGDKVISRVDPVAISGDALVNDQHQDMPSSIAEIVDSFLRSRQVTAREVPVSAEDFHGDGVAGQVAVIGADSELWDRVDTAAPHVTDNHLFEVADSAATSLLGDGVSNFGNETAAFPTESGMGIGSKRGAFDRAELTHSGEHGFAAPPNYNPGITEAVVDGVAADAKLARQIQDGSSGEVFLDDVIHIERDVVFTGHVYNLETEQGHYTSNGIVTHNCRCGLVSRRQLSARGAKPNAASERLYLRTVIKENGVSQAARIVGSKAKLAAALSSSPIEDIINIHRPVPYRLGKVGD